MKKFLKLFLLAIIVIMTTSSCSTERRTLTRMDRLTTRIEKYGEFYGPQDWKAAVDDYKQIAQDSKQCNFTPAERERMGEMEGRCLAGFARWAGDRAIGVIREGKGLIRGLLDGLGLGN